MSEPELRRVIKTAAARERNWARASQWRHRKTRLDAVAVYITRFGEADFLTQFRERKLPPLENMWLPGGYAWWKERMRSNPSLQR